MTGSELRAVARLGRRTARREWRRTTLVAALVAVPVMVGVVVAGVVRAAELTPAEQVTREFGQAELHVSFSPGEKAGAERVEGDVPVPAWPEGGEVVDALLREAAGDADVVRFRQFYDVDGPVTDLDVTSPLARGRIDLVAGRAPSSASEVALSADVLARRDATVGDAIRWSDGSELTVVGEVQDPTHVRASLAVVTPERLDRLVERAAGTWSAADAHSPSWLVGEVGDVDAFADRVRSGMAAAVPADVPRPAPAAGADGGAVIEQATPVDVGFPPSVGVETREQYRAMITPSSTPRRDQILTPQVIATLVTGLLLAEVALIAGAAYATGARRRLRELGLLGANGATTTHVRAVVVGEATLTGVVGGLVGVVAGVAALAFGRPLAQRFVAPLITHLELSVTDLVGPAVIAVVAVSLAAWLPARTAAQVPTTTALQGRMPLSAPKRWITPLGVVLTVFGALLLLVGLVASGTVGGFVAAVGVIGAIAGAAMLTVPLIAGMGRFADRLPAMLRLVVRDSGRQRTRAAAASASAMVVLIAPVLVATLSMTDEQQQLVHGLPTPDNHVFVPPSERFEDLGDGVTAEAVRAGDREDAMAVLDDELPSAAQAPVTVLDERARIAPAPQFFPVGTNQSLYDLEPGTAGAFWQAGPVQGIFVAVGTPDLARALHEDVATALADGHPVVLGLSSRDTTVRLAGQELTAVEVPVPVIHDFPRVLLPPGMGDELGLGVAGTGDLLVTPEPISGSTATTLYRTINGLDIAVGSAGVRNGPVVRWLAVAATLLVALVILALVTMLSATESDHDLRTMVAVGGPPRMRRRFLGLQGAVHALVGSVLAVPLALTLALATISTEDYRVQGAFGSVTSGSMWVDWGVVAAVLLAVPAVIGLAIALLVRSAATVPPRRVG